jgi:hypothetical protein
MRNRNNYKRIYTGFEGAGRVASFHIVNHQEPLPQLILKVFIWLTLILKTVAQIHIRAIIPVLLFLLHNLTMSLFLLSPMVNSLDMLS